ncbi:MAG: hypothetical protein JWL76_371 [Thermoleophilia bacterium]|nr:hypothetical protein [Thermoleophilia bacterium]
MSGDAKTFVDEALREALGQVDPDGDARAAALEARVLNEHGVRLNGGITSNDRRTRDVRGRRRVRRWARVGAIAALATAIIVAVALAPWESETSRMPRLAAPGSASAALLQAGEAAGDETWRPLRDNEYVHVFAVSYAPDFEGIDRRSMMMGFASASETWLASDGTGQVLSISGGSGKPDEYPSFSRDPKTGKIGGIGSRSPAPDENFDVRRSIATPNSVNLMAWPRDGRLPFQRAWVRTPDGFLKTDDFVMDKKSMGQTQSGERNVAQWWGTSLEAINAANEDPDPDHAVRGLLAFHLKSGQRPFRGGSATINGQKQPEATISQAQRDREDSIQHAVQLLGGAPLSPDVRRSLFRWLAEQPGASITKDVKDEFGRAGTRIRFTSDLDEGVKSYKVSARQIVEGASGLGGPAKVGDIDLDRVYSVETRIRRSWRVEAMLDVQDGELLQFAFADQEQVTGVRPIYVTYAEGPRIDVRDPGGGTFMGGGSVFLAREITTELAPTAAVCRSAPETCH